jgi:protein-disulfide isomerase
MVVGAREAMSQELTPEFRRMLTAAVVPGAHVKGSTAAPLTLEEFADFQCPDSKKAWPVMKQLMAHYGENLRFIQHHLPLPYHRNAFDASQAAEVAHEKGKFWEMAELLYEKQDDWNKLTDKKEVLGKFTEYAESIGVDREFFTKGMDNRDYNTRVRQSWKFGAGRGMNGTPSFAINGAGIQASEEWTLDNWRQVIDPLLAQYRRAR